MATRYFLLIDGINGGSTDEAHRGWFDISGYNLEVTSAGAGPGSTGGAGAGRTEFSPLTVSLSLDTGLAELLQSAATGTHLRGIQIEGVTEGAAPQPIFDLTLGDVTVASVHEESGVNDSLVFDYRQIGLVTHVQRPDGSTAAAESFGFDLTANRAIASTSLPSLSPGATGSPPAAPATEPASEAGAQAAPTTEPANEAGAQAASATEPTSETEAPATPATESTNEAEAPPGSAIEPASEAEISAAADTPGAGPDEEAQGAGNTIGPLGINEAPSPESDFPIIA